MSNHQEVLNKLSHLIDNKSSKWIDDVKFREDNKQWLKRSQAIALKILRAIRAEGITQKVLAERIGVSPQQVNKWVKGKENFTLETISKIEKALNIELIAINGSKRNNNSITVRTQIYKEVEEVEIKKKKAKVGCKIISLNRKPTWSPTEKIV